MLRAAYVGTLFIYFRYFWNIINEAKQSGGINFKKTEVHLASARSR